MERPSVPYSEIFERIDGHEGLSMEERLQVKAIDIMVEALMNEENIEGSFGGLTLGDSSRLTSEADPNYQQDLLWGVHTPSEFFKAVTDNVSSEGFDQGLLARWRDKMGEIAIPVARDLPDEAKAKKLVRDLLNNGEAKQVFAVGAA